MENIISGIINNLGFVLSERFLELFGAIIVMLALSFIVNHKGGSKGFKSY
jgi:hypothetical protein